MQPFPGPAQAELRSPIGVVDGQPSAAPFQAAWSGSGWSAPLTPLLTALALAALSLLLLRLLALVALELVGRLADPLMERVRSANDQERVERILAASLQARQRDRSAVQAGSRRLRVTDLNGRPLSLLPEDIPAFQRRCCQELGLPSGSGWPQIRQHWRRQSLRWHPDRGGDTPTWLRKLRAYEALHQLQSETRRWQAKPLPPLLEAPAAARRRWWAGWGQPSRAQQR